MNTALHFSSKRDDWATPPEVFDPLHAEFGFTLDAAAAYDNAKCVRFYHDALTVDWPANDVIWCNPPYSGGLQKHFIRKAAECAIRGGHVVMLLPARTDTRVFHRWIWDTVDHRPLPWVREVRFLKGRIKFVGAEHGAPFPSMVVVFGR